MKTILITGINGYLGSNLAKRYKGEYNVIGLEYDINNLYRIRNENFKVYPTKDGISEGIFEDNKIDIIIHTATFYGRDKESNSKMLYANTFLPLNLIDKALNYKVDLIINTDTVLNRYTSSYALTKKQFRDWLYVYSQKQITKIVNLQLEHFYGPGTSITNFITLMVQKMLRNEATIPLTKAEQNRDFLFIDDLLKVYDLMLEKYKNLNSFEEFIVGFGSNTNLKKILEYIKKTTNSSSFLDYGAIPYRENELMESKNNIERLLELGWQPEVSIERGLLKVIEFEK